MEHIESGSLRKLSESLEIVARTVREQTELITQHRHKAQEGLNEIEGKLVEVQMLEKEVQEHCRKMEQYQEGLLLLQQEVKEMHSLEEEIMQQINKGLALVVNLDNETHKHDAHADATFN